MVNSVASNLQHEPNTFLVFNPSQALKTKNYPKSTDLANMASVKVTTPLAPPKAFVVRSILPCFNRESPKKTLLLPTLEPRSTTWSVASLYICSQDITSVEWSTPSMNLKESPTVWEYPDPSGPDTNSSTKHPLRLTSHATSWQALRYLVVHFARQVFSPMPSSKAPSWKEATWRTLCRSWDSSFRACLAPMGNHVVNVLLVQLAVQELSYMWRCCSAFDLPLAMHHMHRTFLGQTFPFRFLQTFPFSSAGWLWKTLDPDQGQV